jgi:probable HAF family extracellular repeat protein
MHVAANVVRNRLAHVNASAADRVVARNGISRSCMCYSIDNLGGGGGETYGKAVGRLLPIQIANGVDFSKVIEQSFVLGASAQIRGSAFATSASSNAVAAERIDCLLQLNREASVVIGHDLSDMNERHVEIAAANEHGSIVGQLRRPVAAPPTAFLWIKGQEILDLGTFGGSMSNATDVNNANVVVGSAGTSENRWKAFLWRDGEPKMDLGSMSANNSSAKAVNDHCVVVGSIYRSPATPQTDYHRAFRWSPSEGMTLISGTEHSWSQAMDINNKGEILGWCSGPRQMCSFLWSETTGIRLMEGAAGRPFYASCINDSSLVIGEADDESGVRRAMIWSNDAGVRQLSVPFSFHPISIDNDGNIVGHDSERPWSGAWLLSAKGKLVSLSGGADHSVDARKIVGRAVFGHIRAEGWKHVHPVRWDFYF